MLVSLLLVGLPGMVARPTAAAVVFTVTAAADGDDGSCNASHCRPPATRATPTPAPTGSRNSRSSAESDGATTTVSGTLASTPATAFALDFLASAACDGSGHGEGGTHLGSTTITTDGAGQASFSTELPAIAAGSPVTATATGPAGDTSEFSACTAAGAAPPGSVRFGAAAYTVDEGAGTATVTVIRTGGAGGTVTVDVPAGTAARRPGPSAPPCPRRSPSPRARRRPRSRRPSPPTPWRRATRRCCAD